MVIEQLIEWRRRNGLSQRGAAEVMEARQCPISINQIQAWEQSKRVPPRLEVQVLQRFLSEHPTIENPPIYRPGPKK
jgi:transcriptional regulator with XRE-family HTH domain